VVAAVHRQLGVRLGLSALVERPTPAELAAAVDAAVDATRSTSLPPTAAQAPGTTGAFSAATPCLPPSLVPLRPQGTKRPFFIVHGAGGNVLNLQGLARQIDPERPVWGLQAHGVDGQVEPDPTIEAMASRYLDAVRHVQPHGPYLLGGYSGGGIVALEMSRQLAQSAEQVDLAVLFDTFKPHFVPETSLDKARGMLQNIREHGLRTVVTAEWLREAANRRLAKVGLGLSGATEADVPAEVDLFLAFEDAVRRYEYGHYPTNVVLLRAAPLRPTHHPDYSWPDDVSGRFEEYRVPGDHYTLFAPKHTPALAATVTEALDRADRLGGSRRRDRLERVQPPR
jgi:thioesterase domain-containing protein